MRYPKPLSQSLLLHTMSQSIPQNNANKAALRRLQSMQATLVPFSAEESQRQQPPSPGEWITNPPTPKKANFEIGPRDSFNTQASNRDSMSSAQVDDEGDKAKMSTPDKAANRVSDGSFYPGFVNNARNPSVSVQVSGTPSTRDSASVSRSRSSTIDHGRARYVLQCSYSDWWRSTRKRVIFSAPPVFLKINLINTLAVPKPLVASSPISLAEPSCPPCLDPTFPPTPSLEVLPIAALPISLVTYTWEVSTKRDVLFHRLVTSTAATTVSQAQPSIHLPSPSAPTTMDPPRRTLLISLVSTRVYASQSLASLI